MRGKVRCGFLFVLIALVAGVLSDLSSQPLFRSGIFLHHSTGGSVWGPNGSSTSVPLEIASYNSRHGLGGDSAVTLNETAWPVTPWDNEWERWHRIFYNMDTIDADIRPWLAANKIVMIKSCYPSSDMWAGVGSALDTLAWTRKSLWNYKWHWRKIVAVMRENHHNFFILWTNIPLLASATDAMEASLSSQFSRWAKDTLAQGLDAEVGAFPDNVYVFDIFHKLADSAGMMPMSLAIGPGDNHPNAAATELVAPQLVEELFTAAIQYESVATLPVALSTMSVTSTGSGTAQLRWKTETESDCYGFEVLRKVESPASSWEGSWMVLGFVPGRGTSSVPYDYEYNDANLRTGRYRYRLSQIDRSGARTVYDIGEVTIGALPAQLMLSANFPNPFNPQTQFSFSVPTDCIARVVVRDLLGRELLTLFDGVAQAGRDYRLTLDGSSLSTGVYEYSVLTGGRSISRRLVVLK